MKKIISLTMHNRPVYANAILKALSECAGIGEYRLILCVEPVNPEVIRIAKSVRFAESEVVVHPRKLGCATNTYEALRRGFEVSDFVIYVQDDDQVAPDALRFFEYAAEHFRDDPSVYTACAFHLVKEPCTESHYYKVMRRPLFTSLTMATWKDRWLEPGGMRDDWDFDYRYQGWDYNLMFRLRRDRWEVYPWLARTQNIGEEGGAHIPSAAWHRENVRTSFWASDPRVVDKIRANAARAKDLFTTE